MKRTKSNINNTLLVILDGVGENPKSYGNAVAAANMQNYRKIILTGASTLINASGEEVGLSKGSAGNSEVGHNAIGCGQHIKQGLSLLNEQIKSGELFTSDVFKNLCENAKDKRFHLIILLSDGKVHSSIDHLFEFLKEINKTDSEIKISIHALLDGRDVNPQSANTYIEKTKKFISKNKINAIIATVVGRGYALMDRYESNVALLKKGFDLLVKGEGNHIKDIGKELTSLYEIKHNFTDENAPAYVLNTDGLIQNGDSVLLLNYRGDRAIETCKMFEEGQYIEPEDFLKINKCKFSGMMLYDAEINCPQNYILAPTKITNTLTEWLIKNKVKQMSITETQKFGHLSYYFNGNTSKLFDKELEHYKKFDSDIIEFNKKPKMKANKIASFAAKVIKSRNYGFVKCNFANGDMVGHTGDFKATVKAMNAVDKALGKLFNVCKKTKTNLIMVSDHGNAEFMLDENGNPRTNHTNSLVWFACQSFDGKEITLNKGEFGLTNIAGTVCCSIGIEQNPVWNKSIISKK